MSRVLPVQLTFQGMEIPEEDREPVTEATPYLDRLLAEIAQFRARDRARAGGAAQKQDPPLPSWPETGNKVSVLARHAKSPDALRQARRKAGVMTVAQRRKLG